MNQTQIKDYYFVLQVDPRVSQAEVDSAYRRLAMLYHPDLNHASGATLKMQDVNEAYAILRDPAKRARYDLERATLRMPPRERMERWQPPQRSSPRPTRPTSTYTTPPPYTPPVQPRPEAEEQVLVFYLDHTSYGLSIGDVEGVVMMQPISPHPRAPAFVEGVMIARGAYTPIINLRSLLGLPSRPITRDSRIVLMRMSGMNLGVVVDSVGAFEKIPVSHIEASSVLRSERNNAFVRGVAHKGVQLIVMLNSSGLLTESETAALRAFCLPR